MGFKDENGNALINDEQKIRIALSERALITMAEDMSVFSVPKASTFINTVFQNYRSDAKSSISLYLQQRKSELSRLFAASALDEKAQKKAVNHLIETEKQEIVEKTRQYQKDKASSKLYHINDDNFNYLLEDCDEDKKDYYNMRPGKYIRAVIEEYCSLPFIQREKIYRKQVYDIIEQACKEHRILKVAADYYGTNEQFYVYPYKIVPDSFHTQSYLVCYSRKKAEEEKDKIVASFSMARINLPTMLTKTFHLNQAETKHIEEQITKYSPAYLIGRPEQIRVRLTERGKQAYRTRLFSRPEKIGEEENDIYVFNCSSLQIMNYFFSFGADAEIISPKNLRIRFKNKYAQALALYDQTQP